MERLQELYEAWFERYDRSPKLVIDVDELDFVNSDEDRALVLRRVREALASQGWGL